MNADKDLHRALSVVALDLITSLDCIVDLQALPMALPMFSCNTFKDKF